MNDYGRGAVLADATVLPATAAAGFFLADGNPIVLAGLFIVGLISLVNLVAYISRYFSNKKG
jgi:hypothetical protein